MAWIEFANKRINLDLATAVERSGNSTVVFLADGQQIPLSGTLADAVWNSIHVRKFRQNAEAEEDPNERAREEMEGDRGWTDLGG